jgi:hypothetical protein
MPRNRGIASILALALSTPSVVLAQSGGLNIAPLRGPSREKVPPPTPRKIVNVEDLFTKTEIPYAYPNAIDLQGMTVGGLSETNSTSLGANLFVVIDNTKYATMTELYRANRTKGKSNFVTVDALMHSFLAVRNGMLANSIEEQLEPELTALLAGMIKTTAADYKETDDAEVRSDIERNLAFLSVGLRLLDPGLPIPALGNATGLATKELHNIKSYQTKRSAIFNVDEDFSTYKPYGWYDSSPKLQNFFRAKQWLSRVSFSLSENSNNEGGDSFRRSALLFHALDKSTAGNQPGMQVWQRINQMMAQIGPPASTEIKTLLASDYKAVFKSANPDMKMSLQGLSEPFYRTKLLLSVRRQRPLQISATSIFEIDSSHPERASQACFRLFPIVESPELPWLNQQGHHYAKEGSDVPAAPLGLLALHGHGIAHATNVLADNVWKLDPTLVTTVPPLVQTIKKQPNSDVVWQILATYFKLPTDPVQPVFKTNNWMTRKLESGFGAWLDNQLTCASDVQRKNDILDEDNLIPNPPLKANTSSKPPSTPTVARSNAPSATPSGTPSAAPSGTPSSTPALPATVRAPNFQYVEPCPDVFRNMRTEIQRLSTQMSSIGYAPQKFEVRIQEFVTLLQRLETVASREVNGINPNGQDAFFLANIDTALEKFSPHTLGSLLLDTGTINEDAPRGSVTTGATLVLGHPAMLFMIFQTGRSLAVARGAMYSYHEIGGPVTRDHLDRKMEYGFLTPPSWTESFEVIQEQTSSGGN